MDRPSQSLLLDISAGGIVRHLRYVLRDSPGYRLSMTSLPTRKIGPYTVSTISYGAMSLSSTNYGHPPDRNAATKLLNRALDLGITMLDTAAIYGDGDNERLFAGAINHRREEFLLASKGVLHSVDGKRTLDGLPKAISETLDASLSRLCTDHIDLYYLHRLDRLVPIEESIGAVVRAIEAGKVGAIGLSEMSAATIRRAHAVHPIAAIQSEYSPMVRNPEIAVLETCRELGIGFVAFSPTARGLLAGAIVDDRYDVGDIRNAMPRFVGDNLRHNLALAHQFFALANAHGLTPAQLSLAWVISRADHVIPIFGTANPSHLEQNVHAAAITLTTDVIMQIEEMFEGQIAGARYSASLQSQIDTEIFANETLE
jgi:aryl-alcohol dehydrogenase-like predicted oxidoreductase